ncbi:MULTISPECIES: ATP-binding cassette domain-containing protein [Streptomyces]|uniref:ATP-binding cassette domain-containing protein n=1 Tax=Streptomyces TaxID=1883 RepID=UPI001315D196|nr:MULTISPECIES: ATP-binding cassette domain-containing protein [Streptomyces]QGZ48221.1 ATP-binding cassette domain-containing protein [Streptomyces sp. QHH-9511]GGT75421.1 ABC transporter ATP-binding protein [Streptomyces lateritius]
MSVEIALRRARVHYGPLEALHGLDLPLPAATVTVLLGRNGAGRTTALRALAGTVSLSSGRVLWRGADVTRTPAHERARRGLCFVPDLRAVYATLTVAENLELASRDREAALEAYPELAPLLAHPAGTLSGGERRMLALTRALLTPARVVLVDEPALGMSPAVASRTYRLLAALALRGGAAVALAEQRLPPGLPPGTLVHELRRGSLAFSGEAAELTSGR